MQPLQGVPQVTINDFREYLGQMAELMQRFEVLCGCVGVWVYGCVCVCEWVLVCVSEWVSEWVSACVRVCVCACAVQPPDSVNPKP